MILVAEYVSPGHPDRLCDAIVNNIVNYVVKKDKDGTSHYAKTRKMGWGKDCNGIFERPE